MSKPSSSNNLQMITLIGILVGQWKRIRILETNALPFSGKSKTSFGCTSASTFRLVVAYFDLIPQADSTTEIFATAITLTEVIIN